MDKPWEHMSRDEKLDHMQQQLNTISEAMLTMAKHQREISERLNELAQMREVAERV
jgi:hypothetical protein